MINISFVLYVEEDLDFDLEDKCSSNISSTSNKEIKNIESFCEKIWYVGMWSYIWSYIWSYMLDIFTFCIDMWICFLYGIFGICLCICCCWWCNHL